MDYRKPAIFGENWSPSRYKVLPYFAAEKALFEAPDVQDILDYGCANGWNMSRFRQYGCRPIGLDIVAERVQLAAAHGPVMIASGLQIPLGCQSMDIVYSQHVLHHIGNLRQALSEMRRCLRPDGTLFLVETVEDNPLIRWGRRLYPNWLGDDISVSFAYDDLQKMLVEGGFQVVESSQYSVLFWLWEIFPDQLPFMEKLTPLFVALERVLAKFWRHHSAHCYVIARLTPANSNTNPKDLAG